MGAHTLKAVGVFLFNDMKCEGCGKESDYLEKHHIVPKSRGGDDIPSNISYLCVECHSKAHDVSFSKKDSGIVKDGLTKLQQTRKDAQEWFNDTKNEDEVHDMIMAVYYHDPLLSDFIVRLIENDEIEPYHLKEWHDTGVLWYGGRRRKKWIIRDKGIYVD